MEFLVALASIMMVNIVLSGDNAVVIAMASRCLPPKQQKMAILWGSAGAIGLRVLLTLVAVVLLQIPYVQFVGGLLLIWIAAKLLMEDKGEDHIKAGTSLMAAIKTIIVADLVMSLDNTLAIAAVARGDYLLLISGLALSIPLIVFGSQIIIKIMDRFPVVVYAGAGLIAWTAGEMIMDDQKIGPVIHAVVPEWFVAAAITIGVLTAGLWWKRTHKTAVGSCAKEGNPAQ
ncbi:TerC family protein [Sporomusa acidovorans]|uniref:Integral membrane protein TerC family protein n=1 Tax=Sporomusa acidovorans (strain ATCC 49682 / DSM 3132 / Mol) TaxID=1123286 RepID=A0ABZ3IVJ1_SPOA4|nr:TerC family protein [Sporomusa acidovorans]OZC15251.1 integral membrane protein TerC family protein [Sporomusa acidovorans DSM 3132]SDE91217.1 integral membrane protein, YjbE family [Sporomusa acidovorans]